MKKLLAILLAAMMVFALAACGDNNTTDPDKDNPGVSQSGENNDDKGGTENQGGENNDVTVRTAAIDGYELPDAALAYVGTLNKAYNDQYNDGEITFYVKSTNADDDAFDALIDYYASNGGTLDEANSTSAEKCFDFEWGRIEVSHFGADEEISAYIILPEYPIADNGGEDTSVGQWQDTAYSAYTNGVEEPTFTYTIKGVIMDQLTINAEATVDEVNAWKQSLLNAGFEEYREGEQWGVSNATHNIQMNGFVNGVAYIYIGLQG